jgi:hypothetical protein
MDCLGALTRRGWPLVQLDWPAAKSRARNGVPGHSRACARAASPCPLGAAVWKPEVQHEMVQRHTNVPCKTFHGLTAGIHTRLIARRQRAQKHEWPRSSYSSRGGSSAARWPAHRQVKGLVARLDTTGSTQGRDQGEGEVKTAAAALTLGRRCSRGRLGEDGRRSLVVHDGDVPALLLPPCVVIPERSLLGSSFLGRDGAPVSSARHGQRLAPSSFPFLPLLLSLQWNRGLGKTPKQMVAG